MSSYTPIFQGEIKNNKITIIKAKKMWADWITSLNNKKVEVNVKEWKSNRSRNQNSLMWAWLSILEQETGQPKEDIHDYFKKKFLMRIIKIKGKPEKVVGSTTNLDTKEFTEYLEKLRETSAVFFNVNLPDPYEWF